MNQFYCGLSCTMLVLTDGLILSVAKLIKRQINLFFCCPDKKVLQDLEWQQLMLNPGKIPSLIQKVWIKNCSAFCEQSVRFHRVSMCQLMSVDFSKCVWIIGQLSMKKKSCCTGQKVSRFRDRFLRGDFPQKIVKTTMTANRSLEILRFLEYFDVWQLHKCSFIPTFMCITNILNI